MASASQDNALDPKRRTRGPVAPHLHGDKLLPPEEIDKMIATAAKEEAPLAGFQSGTNLDRIIFETPEGSHVLGQLSKAQAQNMLRAKGCLLYTSDAADEL